MSKDRETLEGCAYWAAVAIVSVALIGLVAYVVWDIATKEQRCHDAGLAYTDTHYGGCIKPPPTTAGVR